MSKTEGKELMIPITATAIELYEGGVLDAVLAEIEKKARAHKPDLRTKKSRDAIRSNAALVTGSKTYLFQLGKDLTEDHRAKVKSTNDVRNKMEERLNTLKDEVRKPLTEWEAIEAAKVAKIQDLINEFKESSLAEHSSKPSECLFDRIKEIKAVVIDESFGDYANQVAIEKDKAIDRLQFMAEAAEQREADEAELEKLRAEAAEREEKERQEKEAQFQIDREHQIRKEEGERVEREAEDKRMAERLEQEAAQAKERRENELRIQEAKDREEKALREKKEAEERLEMAATNERQRIEREQEQARIDADRREANTKHKAKINNASADAIAKAAGLTKEQAQDVVKAIASGKVPHTSIQY